VSDLLQRAHDWALTWQRSRRVPGMALVVTDRTDTLLVAVTGLADRAGMRPVSPDQRWQIGSISKAFTSIAVLQLEAEGRLSVDDRVTDHLGWLSPHLHPEITLHHLMSHTAGLPGGSEWSSDSLLESAVQGTVGRPQSPGGRYHYSNPGYELLGDVVEHVTGELLEHRLEQRVLRPMGMTGSVASVTPDDRDRDVRGHRPPRDDEVWHGQSEQVPDVFFPTCTADGAIAATPDDLARYLRFLLNQGADGVLGTGDFVRLAGRHVDTGDGWYGYGLHTREAAGRTTLGHSGGMVGMFADVRVDQAAGLGVGMMINGMGDVSGATTYLLDTVCEVAAAEPSWPWTDPRGDAADTGTGPELAAFTGLYRSYNPWVPTVRVIALGGVLHLVDPVEGVTSSLHAEADRIFRVEHPDSPDVAEFDVMVDQEYQRLELSGCVYARTRRC
jgi:CubicO group peptidase (beta-lactamase class C family)